MFKFICLVALFAVASAQNWHPRPPVWNEPQVPLWPQPQPPIWNQPQQPQPPIIWNPPQNVPQDRPGVRDHRCPSTNDRFVTLFPHERDCSQFYMCNAGFRCKRQKVMIIV